MERCRECKSEDVEIVNVSEVAGWGEEGRPLRRDTDMVCQTCGSEQRRTETFGS